MVDEGYVDKLLTVQHVKSGQTFQFIGSVTMWRSFPGFQRQDIFARGWLADIYDAIEHYRAVGGKLPKARSSKTSIWDDFVMGSYRFVSMEPSGRDELLTLEREPNFLGRLLGKKPQTLQYLGDCTVWRSYPQNRRQGILMEGMLHEFWERARYMRRHRQ